MKPPPLPSLRTLTAELRALHEAWAHPDAGGEYVRLVCLSDGGWSVAAAGQIDALDVAFSDARVHCVYGWEFVPGDGAPFDPVAVARRLLAAVPSRQ